MSGTMRVMTTQDQSGKPILLRGGRVIDPATRFDQTADVLLADGLVHRIDTKKITAGDATVIDAQGLIVCPGLIDPHVHLREPSGGDGPAHDETIATGSAAALNGGYTTVCCMPNTTPALDTVAMIQFVQARATAADHCRVLAVGCATQQRRGETLAELQGMAGAGAVAFSDDGNVVASAAMMTKVLRTAHAVDRCFMQHCQEPTLTVGGVMNAGALAQRLGLTGWPNIAEELIIARDIMLNRDIGCRYHAQHVSCCGSVELIRTARSEGQPVTGEASPHHLLLTDDACANYDTLAKMNPPLRTQSDVDALKAGVADGTITVLATDHAPHPMHTKLTDFASASFGVIGVECALPLYVKALIADGVLDWPALLKLMTIEPATLIGLDRMGLGWLEVGGPADVTLIDPELKWTITGDQFVGTGANCPFFGSAVTGRAVGAIVGGRLKMSRLGARGASHHSAMTPGKAGS
jgi:dihydroorotase